MNSKLTGEEIASYHERGYFVVDEVFDAEELESFNRALLYTIRILVKQAAKGENPFAGARDIYEEIDQATHWLEEHDHYYIAQLYHLIADIPEFLRLGIKPELSQIAAQLLEADQNLPLYTLTKRCRIDLSTETDYTFGWHQEVFYSIPRSHFLQSWAPLLRPSTIDNGTIEVAVGSHREGVLDQHWNIRDGVPSQILVKDEVIDRFEVMPIILKPGQLIFFSNKMAHRSGQNNSGTTRFSLVSSFHRMDSKDFQAPRFRAEYIGISPRDYYSELLGHRVAAGDLERVSN